MMSDPDLLDTYPDEMLMDNPEDDMLDDILNTLLDDPTHLDVKSEFPMLGTSSSANSSSRRSGGSLSSSSNNKKRKYNPDAEKIAEVTEAALLSLEIDPNSQDAKKKRRQIRNRLSAQFHRDRKNAYIKELEEKNSANQTLVDSLQKRIAELEKENEILKEQLGYYHSTLRSGTTTSLSDSEVSSSGSSPVHQPTFYNPPSTSSSSTTSSTSTTTVTVGTISGSGSLNNLNSLREIVPQNRNTTIPLPVAKTLSLLSVLCILCMTYLDHPLKVNPSMENGPIANLPAPPRRRLEAPLAAPQPHHQHMMEERFVYPSSVNDSTPSSVGPTNQYLRGSQNTNHSLNGSAATTKLVFNSRDLIPFDLPYQYQRDWYSSQDPFDALSYSHIVMNKGVALFHPSLKVTRPTVTTASMDNSKMAVVPAVKTIYPQHHDYPRIDYEAVKKGLVMDVNESKEQDEGEATREVLAMEQEEKHWPAITAPPISRPVVNERSFDSSDCSNCAHMTDSVLLAKLLEKSNLVTVTVPASSVRVGKTIQDSEDGTVEGIMEMFNLTNDYAEGKNNQSGSSSSSPPVYHNALADASVEINCIILSAKLVLNAAKH